MRQPASYPDKPERIEEIETHMSWVFLSRDYAYKMKKPVRYPFLDFSTLEGRHRDCDQELRLNHRLAPDVYLDVVPLIVQAEGDLALAGRGKPVEWLVKMRRLPADRMLDHMIRHHAVNEADVRNIGMLLAHFYLRSSPIEIDPSEYRHRYRDEIRANLQELARPNYDLLAQVITSVCAAQLRFLAEQAAAFDARVQAGRIVEAHGDLRPEHICLEDPPVIIDCLLSKREFRLLDPVDELAFFAMECERLGAESIGGVIREIYVRVTGDQVAEALWNFYKGYRACVRAKISAWHLDDPDVHDSAKWIERAKAYLHLAQKYAPVWH